MIDCPHCAQPVTEEAIACPHCGTTLKAYGHPGMTLYRARGEQFLCQTCIYDQDDSCTYPQRPYARDCTLYTTSDTLNHWATQSARHPPSLGMWLKRHTGLLVVVGLLLVSLVLALTAR